MVLETPNFRKLWFEHVAKTRKKGTRKNKAYTHRDAMRDGSKDWPKIKDRLERKFKRELKKQSKLAKPTSVSKEDKNPTSRQPSGIQTDP